LREKYRIHTTEESVKKELARHLAWLLEVKKGWDLECRPISFVAEWEVEGRAIDQRNRREPSEANAAKKGKRRGEVTTGGSGG